ncbi:MAG: GyrI-like domain-containing protein [Chlamydiota bacterium]
MFSDALKICLLCILPFASQATSINHQTEAGESENSMTHIYQKQKKKFILGIGLKTSNQEFLSVAPALWNRFYQEILANIPNPLDRSIFAVYTDYEGDHTKPYFYLIGCEVSSLDHIPKGMVGKIIPESNFAVFKTEGEFPQSVALGWQKIWTSNLKRVYTADFEIYGPDFNPQTHSEVKIFIAVEK